VHSHGLANGFSLAPGNRRIDYNEISAFGMANIQLVIMMVFFVVMVVVMVVVVFLMAMMAILVITMFTVVVVVMTSLGINTNATHTGSIRRI